MSGAATPAKPLGAPRFRSVTRYLGGRSRDLDLGEDVDGHGSQSAQVLEREGGLRERSHGQLRQRKEREGTGAAQPVARLSRSRRAGSARMSIARTFPSATVKPSTEYACSSLAVTIPAAPFTRAGRAKRA